MSTQQQFLNVVPRDEAERRLRAAVSWEPLGEEVVPLDDALGRILADDVRSHVDVPSFDRSNFDGFAVRAGDTYAADEENPRRVKLLPEVISPGDVPKSVVTEGTAVGIATGAMLPRGADAVVLVEHTDVAGDETAPELLIYRPVSAGFGISFTGTDISSGEIVLRRGQKLTSRETGVLAAIGTTVVTVWRKPRVAIFSTGNEIVPPGTPMQPGLVYDSNAQILADAVRELGGKPLRLGIVPDNLPELRTRLADALNKADLVLLSGGTSKGAGDLCYRAVQEFTDPGIVAHGVALKPGKPLCLAAAQGKCVTILPGFPTSAVFTFHEFIAPLIRALAGTPATADPQEVTATLAVRILSEIGRTEYALVGLVETGELPVAFPMGKGSGSVTTFSRADGFITIGRQEEIVEAQSPVRVRLLGRGLMAADLVVIGSHCLGLDMLLGLLQDQGFQTKLLAVGSTAGLRAVKAGEAHLAGIHLLDPQSGEYNRPFLDEHVTLIRGYGREQGIVFRPDDERFAGKNVEEVLSHVIDQPDCLMVNRNQGSGTRIVIDGLLDRYLAGKRPPGYAIQPNSHNAVAAAVAQGRADWGIAIRSAAAGQGLGFLPVADEQYDFAVPMKFRENQAVVALAKLLEEEEVKEKLREMGFRLP